MGNPILKSWAFEASEDIITKFKSQGLYSIRIPTHWNIGILLYKQAKLRKYMQQSVSL